MVNERRSQDDYNYSDYKFDSYNETGYNPKTNKMIYTKSKTLTVDRNKQKEYYKNKKK